MLRPLARRFPWLRTVRHRLLALRGSVQTRKIFRDIYHSGYWLGSESASGWGSDLPHTEKVRSMLPEILQELGVRTFIDAPCGDFNWMRRVDLGSVQYVGLDIVPELIEENRRQFEDAQHRFMVADLSRDELPQADLILCRDCLVHLPLRDAQRVIANFKRSGAYLLTTTFPDERENSDILTGAWRKLNLERPPFNFPPPIRCDSDAGPEANPKWQSKSLGLWRLKDL